MDSFLVYPELSNSFKLGQEVWFIDFHKKVDSDTIRSICFELIPCDGEEKLVCVGYKLHVMHTDAADGETYRPHELYDSQQTAESLATWRPVADITDSNWLAAIGDRDADDIENCELGICCSGISDVRDILIECKTSGGLMERDVQRISKLLRGSGHPDFLEGSRPVLSRVFSQLGVNLDEKE